MLLLEWRGQCLSPPDVSGQETVTYCCSASQLLYSRLSLDLLPCLLTNFDIPIASCCRRVTCSHDVLLVALNVRVLQPPDYPSHDSRPCIFAVSLCKRPKKELKLSSIDEYVDVVCKRMRTDRQMISVRMSRWIGWIK